MFNLNLINDAIFIFTQLTPLIRCMVVQTSQCFWRRYVMFDIHVCLTVMYPLLLRVWLIVHDATVSHNTFVICSIILVFVHLELIVRLLLVREKSHGVWKRRRWLLLILNEPSILVASTTMIRALHQLLADRCICKTFHYWL